MPPTDKPNRTSNLIGIGQLVVMVITMIAVPMYLGSLNAEFRQLQSDRKGQSDAITQLVTVTSAQAVVAASHQARLDAHDKDLEWLKQRKQQ